MNINSPLLSPAKLPPATKTFTCAFPCPTVCRGPCGHLAQPRKLSHSSSKPCRERDLGAGHAGRTRLGPGFQTGPPNTALAPQHTRRRETFRNQDAKRRRNSTKALDLAARGQATDREKNTSGHGHWHEGRGSDSMGHQQQLIPGRGRCFATWCAMTTTRWKRDRTISVYGSLNRYGGPSPFP